MSPAETALRTALHNDARSHIGRMFAPKPIVPVNYVPVIPPVNAAMPLKG